MRLFNSIILSIAILLFTGAAFACDKKTNFPGFTLNGVALNECFHIPMMGESYLYKFTAVCKKGGLKRKAFYKMFDPYKGVWRKELSKTVLKFSGLKIKKTGCNSNKK